MQLLILTRMAAFLLVILTGAQISFATPSIKDAPKKGVTQSGGIQEVNQLSESVVKLSGKGKFKEALPLARRALEIAEKIVGAEHRELDPLLANLVEINIGLKQYAEAESIARRSLANLEKALGADHPDLNKAIHRLARVRHLAGGDAEAEALYQRAVSISERTFGAEHLEVARALEKLALFYGGRMNMEASATYSRIASIIEKIPDSTLARIEEPLARYACLKSKFKEVTNLHQGPLDSGELFKGKAASLAKPTFPIEAKRSGAQGQVPVRMLINEEGKVIHACAMGGPKVFQEAATEAALKSTFDPTLVKGRAVKVQGTITFTFLATPKPIR